jgi:hypothetical protein
MDMNFKLFTGETIEVLCGASFTQELKHFNRTIEWDCLEVDMDNMIKAIKSIKYNGVKDMPIVNKEDYLELICDYTSILKTENGDFHLILIFDEQDEQKYHLIFRVDYDELEYYQDELYEKLMV